MSGVGRWGIPFGFSSTGSRLKPRPPPRPSPVAPACRCRDGGKVGRGRVAASPAFLNRDHERRCIGVGADQEGSADKIMGVPHLFFFLVVNGKNVVPCAIMYLECVHVVRFFVAMSCSRAIRSVERSLESVLPRVDGRSCCPDGVFFRGKKVHVFCCWSFFQQD